MEPTDAKSRFDALVWPHAAAVLRTARFLIRDPAEADAGAAADDDPAWDDPQALLRRFGDRDVIRALQRLPEEIRWTLLLVDVEGMDHADAANVLGVPVGTVKSRAHRGRGMPRAALLPLAREMRLIRE